MLVWKEIRENNGGERAVMVRGGGGDGEGSRKVVKGLMLGM